MDFGFTVEFNQDSGIHPSIAYEEAFVQVAIAEQMGLDEVWVAEHHSQDGFGPAAPLITAAAIATRTKRLRIGTAILILPLGHLVILPLGYPVILRLVMFGDIAFKDV